MADQAARLREMVAGWRSNTAPAPTPGTRPEVRSTRTVAITSGKGGVGKSNLSINLAHALMKRGQTSLLFDADLGLANAGILLGSVAPYHLGHVLSGQRGILEVIHHSPHGVPFISAGSGVAELASLQEADVQRFVAELAQLNGQADHLLIDTGAGIHPTVLSFLQAADQVVVVTTPEPTSMADGYAVIKTLVQSGRSVPPMGLVINQVSMGREADEVAERLILTARNFLGVELQFLGGVPYDPSVTQAVRRQQPFTVAYPQCPASRAVGNVAERLLGAGSVPAGPHRAGGFFDRLTGWFRGRGGMSQGR